MPTLRSQDRGPGLVDNSIGPVFGGIASSFFFNEIALLLIERNPLLLSLFLDFAAVNMRDQFAETRQ